MARRDKEQRAKWKTVESRIYGLVCLQKKGLFILKWEIRNNLYKKMKIQ